ncbi:MAG TPA: hypothetical protein VK633_09605 [Verrucomicrobiae bacterium]|nr:hypothetical protein [Verrucomicrobiae bacterium]
MSTNLHMRMAMEALIVIIPAVIIVGAIFARTVYRALYPAGRPLRKRKRKHRG